LPFLFRNEGFEFLPVVRTTTILLADNQPLTAAGIRSLIESGQEAEIIGTVEDVSQFAELTSRLKPDLLIIDYNIPGYLTLESLEQVITSTHVNTLIISSDNNHQTIRQSLQAGVKGYITKECSREEIVLAIRSTSKGEKFFCHKILDVIMEKESPASAQTCEPTVLTVRETEILELLAKGYSTQRAADKLNLSPHTIHTHRKSIIRKLGIKSPTEFVLYAIDFGLITISNR
jgi:two-component system, NarL family, invasion response regulator UvrY